MDRVKLHTRLREDMSKSHLKDMRRHAQVPGSFFGKDRPTLPLEIGIQDLATALKTSAGVHAVFEIEVEGAKRGEAGTAVLKDIHTDPITRRVLQVDFVRVAESDVITTPVGITLVGEAPGVGAGGILETIMDEIEVTSRADHIPAHIEVDISALGVGDMIHAGEIALPDGVELASRLDDLVVAVRIPHIHAAATPASAPKVESSALPEAEPPSEEG
jgi:large subunit ribosomal protein L25